MLITEKLLVRISYAHKKCHKNYPLQNFRVKTRCSHFKKRRLYHYLQVTFFSLGPIWINYLFEWSGKQSPVMWFRLQHSAIWPLMAYLQYSGWVIRQPQKLVVFVIHAYSRTGNRYFTLGGGGWDFWGELFVL